tara:strand:- start:362 stop:520 length:159 start_codon:yes stop_codon:yes gene_type:complete
MAVLSFFHFFQKKINFGKKTEKQNENFRFLGIIATFSKKNVSKRFFDFLNFF